MPDLGTTAWHQSEHLDDESNHQATGLDAKKKTVAASERNETARNRWREQMKQVDATQLVVVDETGSNIGLAPIYARAPRGQHASPAVSRATLGKIPRMPGITFPIGHGGSHDFGRSQ